MERLPETKTVVLPTISMETRCECCLKLPRVWKYGGVRFNVSSRQEGAIDWSLPGVECNVKCYARASIARVNY
jgi:hypothetical protein